MLSTKEKHYLGYGHRQKTNNCCLQSTYLFIEKVSGIDVDNTYISVLSHNSIKKVKSYLNMLY